MRILPPLLLATALAACDGPARDAAPAATAPAADGYAAQVAALPATLRAGVMLRAIRDAGQNCQRVAAVEKAGPATWLATCDDHGRWVVAIADDGGATVADARDVARRR